MFQVLQAVLLQLYLSDPVSADRLEEVCQPVLQAQQQASAVLDQLASVASPAHQVASQVAHRKDSLVEVHLQVNISLIEDTTLVHF